METLAVGTDGAEQRIRARYVVGCDGANSFVRDHMGTGLTDLGFFYDWLILDVIPHDQQREWKPFNLQICDPRRPTTVVSGGPGKRRWEFMRLPNETIEELNNEQTAWRLLQPWNLAPDNAVLERHTVYTFQARWADRWRDGRILIAGDAAHLMPPAPRPSGTRRWDTPTTPRQLARCLGAHRHDPATGPAARRQRPVCRPRRGVHRGGFH